jgi:hypothetical protein
MQLGLTALIRDRAPWIKEWIAFHYLVGFRKFYIYTRDCKDNTNEILTELKKHFDIKLFDLGAVPEGPQLKCYQDSYTNFGNEVDWMAFLDGDEFLFPTNSDSVESSLQEFDDKNISALGFYWKCFGSNGHITEPLGLIVENYKRRADDKFVANRHIKSIVRGGQGLSVRAVYNPHLFETPFGTYDENLRPITCGLTDYEPTYEKFRINHYLCQSRSYFLNWKKIIGAADGNRFEIKPESWWDEHDRNDVLDDSMDRFIGPLKNILKSI